MLYVLLRSEMSGIFINSVKNLPKRLKRSILRYPHTESYILNNLVLISGSDSKPQPSETYPQVFFKHTLFANQVFINHRQNEYSV